mmetsp:Transcript_1049/g.2830  ORF Transcript_1049/g.2830 Transcript_1049/m.2830 type:complete len:358 (+) Transcript_1049:359-1432(+)
MRDGLLELVRACAVQAPPHRVDEALHAGRLVSVVHALQAPHGHHRAALPVGGLEHAVPEVVDVDALARALEQAHAAALHLGRREVVIPGAGEAAAVARGAELVRAPAERVALQQLLRPLVGHARPRRMPDDNRQVVIGRAHGVLQVAAHGIVDPHEDHISRAQLLDVLRESLAFALPPRPTARCLELVVPDVRPHQARDARPELRQVDRAAPVPVQALEDGVQEEALHDLRGVHEAELLEDHAVVLLGQALPASSQVDAGDGHPSEAHDDELILRDPSGRVHVPPLEHLLHACRVGGRLQRKRLAGSIQRVAGVRGQAHVRGSRIREPAEELWELGSRNLPVSSEALMAGPEDGHAR